MSSVQVAHFLADRTIAFAESRPWDVRAQCMRALAWAMSNFILLCDNSDLFFNDDQVQAMSDVRHSFFTSILFLSSDSCILGMPHFFITPKLHALQHIMQDCISVRCNPRMTWEYRCEDAVGRYSRLTSRCHATAAGHRILSRWHMG